MKLLVSSVRRIGLGVCSAQVHRTTATALCGNSVGRCALPATQWVPSRYLSTSQSDDGDYTNRKNVKARSAAAKAIDGDAQDNDEKEDSRREQVHRAKIAGLDSEKRKKPWDIEFDEDEWDEARWGAMNSEDWQGFDGDIDATNEEGLPKWLGAVRSLEAISSEKKMRGKLARRAYEEAKKNVVRVRQVDEFGRAYGTGRRKTSAARVWVKPSEKPFQGTIRINGKDIVDYFVRDTYREDILKPFSVVGMIGQFDVMATVRGGGLTGQSGAVRHGISRALQNLDPAYRPALKKEGLLTRDPRMVERKKPGQPKARKKFQWVKR